MKTIYLIGPPEPSGLSWLYNCFLCLGIKVQIPHPRNQFNMWIKTGTKYTLNPVDDMQKKWAPILSKKRCFQFRDDVQVHYGHDWPTGWQRKQSIIFFIRNPFDALFSSWKRNSKDISFGDYLRVRNHLNLLNKIDNWNLFCETWLKERNKTQWCQVRFEDYRRNPEKTLRNVLSFMNLSFSNEEISFALSESSYEEASKAENNYVMNVPEWLEVCDDVSANFSDLTINSGDKNEKTSYLYGAEHKLIMSQTVNVCNEFGYSQKSKVKANDYFPQRALLSFFDHLNLCEDDQSANKDFDISQFKDEIHDIFSYVREISSLFAAAERAGLMFGEVAALIDALEEFKANYLRHVQK